MMEVAKTVENMKKCICMKCPSYSFACKIKSMPTNMMALVDGMANVDHVEGMFCAYEKSRCIDEEKGCICGDCKIFQENGLTTTYFCLATGGK